MLIDKLRDRIVGISKHFTTLLARWKVKHMVNKVAPRIAVLRVKAL